MGQVGTPRNPLIYMRKQVFWALFSLLRKVYTQNEGFGPNDKPNRTCFAICCKAGSIFFQGPMPFEWVIKLAPQWDDLIMRPRELPATNGVSNTHSKKQAPHDGRACLERLTEPSFVLHKSP